MQEALFSKLLQVLDVVPDIVALEQVRKSMEKLLFHVSDATSAKSHPQERLNMSFLVPYIVHHAISGFGTTILKC